MQSYIVFFFSFIFICILSARDKQNVAQEYNICKRFHLVYVVAISVMTNTATFYSWVKSSRYLPTELQEYVYTHLHFKLELKQLIVSAPIGKFCKLIYLSINNR